MSLEKQKLPQHIAIIMDGNRRWAKNQGLNILKGHEYVVNEVVENLIEHCGKLGIRYLTLWVFSTENWKRDSQEVMGLMQLFRMALKTKVAKFIAQGAKLRMIGDIGKFPEDIQKGLQEAVNASEKNNKIVVTYALNYGGRDEIVRAVKRMQVKIGNKETLNSQEQLGKYLDTAGMPDPDLLIRTGGEKRLSGFMPWQTVYSELYFTDILMPDFSPQELDKAIEDYQSRQRRFGK